MAPIRLRHPKGVSTIQVLLDSDDFTVQDLLQEIRAVTEILPSKQILKVGYPPRSLSLVPELPVSSLGLQKGDQIIVSESADAPSSPTWPRPTPAAPARNAPQPQKPTGPDYVEVAGSFLVHRIVPDDNSCLFSSVALVFEQSITKAPAIRQIVADGIKKNPDTYTEAILGMPPEKYIATITKPTTWGGAIELSILASHYQAEIASIDVETGRVDCFTPAGELEPSNRCILIYSGIHYDAATLAPTPDAPIEWHQTLFERSKREPDPVLVAAKRLVGILREKKAFTNTSTFDLKCEQCGQGLKGEKEARAHAEQTGHTRFGEY